MLDLISYKQGKIPHELLGIKIKENLDKIVDIVAETYFELGQRQMNIFDERRILTMEQSRSIQKVVSNIHKIKPGMIDFNVGVTLEANAQAIEFAFPKLFNSKKS